MTAAVASRNAPPKGTHPLQEFFDIGLKGGTKAFARTIAIIQGGFARPGIATTTGYVAGFFDRNQQSAPDGSLDNTAGADGAVTARIRPGTIKLANSGAGVDLITAAMLLQDCFVVDDSTVAATFGGGTRIKAGRIVQVDTDGVWVELGPAHSVPTSLAGQGIQSGTGTMVAGVLSVSNVTITANSTITFGRKAKAGTPGICYDAPLLDRTVGAPATGAFKIRSYSDSGATAAASDTSTIDWQVIG